MNFYTEGSNRELHPELQGLLVRLREEEAVDLNDVITRKCSLLYRYFKEHKLSSAVVAVSGGLDSAITLALVAETAKRYNLPQNIYPVLLPVFNEGATGQDSATARGIELCIGLGLKPCVIPLTDSHDSLTQQICASLQLESDNWAKGQLVSYLRTPALYFITSLCSRNKQPGVLIGTTNRDEGAHIGYFGKASDGLVDIQLISDLHKSELYALAPLLQIPKSIAEVVPTGDMYDGRVDEEVFGVTYDFVELYTRICTHKDTSMLNGLSVDALWQYELLRNRVTSLHSYNAHKYKVGSPAIHLDVLARDPFSWKYFKGYPDYCVETKGNTKNA